MRKGVTIMSENYVYIKVKLSLKDGQTEDSIQNIVSEMDYSFSHDEIVKTEIKDIYDTQIVRWFFDYAVYSQSVDGKWSGEWKKSLPYKTKKLAEWDCKAFAEECEVTEVYSE